MQGRTPETPKKQPLLAWALSGVLLLIPVAECALAQNAPRLRAVSGDIRLTDGDRPPGLDYASYPKIAVAAADRIVVVWNAPLLDGDNPDTAFARWFDGDLEPLTPEFQINTLPHQRDSGDTTVTAAVTSEGDILATWVLDGLTNHEENWSNVYARRFRYPQTHVGDGFRVNTTLNNEQIDPVVLCGSDDNSLILWKSTHFGPYDEVVRFQRYQGIDADGPERFLRNRAVTTSGAGLANREGTFYLAWSGHERDESGASVFVARVEADGTLGLPVIVAETRASFPALAELGNGNILVVWRQEVAASEPAGLYSRVLNPNLIPVTGVRPVWVDQAPTERRDKLPRLSASAGGAHAVLVWEVGVRFKTSQDVMAQVLDLLGEPVGAPLMVNAQTNGGQGWSTVAYLSASRVVIGWTTTEHDGPATVPVARLFDVGSVTPLCGDANDDGFLLATDGLACLRAAVGLAACEPCRCDVNVTGSQTAADALLILRASVGLPVALGCPVCEPSAD